MATLRSFEYFKKFSTEKQTALAFKEYCESKVSKWEALMGVLSQIIVASEDQILSQLDISDLLSSFDFTADQTVLLNRGYASLGNLFHQVSQAAYHDINYESLTQIIVYNDDGSEKSYTLDELSSEINATYHAIVVQYGVAVTFSMDITSIVDRIATLRDVIADKFVSAYSDTSSTLLAAVNCIRNGFNLQQYLDYTLVYSGLVQAAESSITFDQSDAMNYTGASPASAFCLNTVFGVAEATVSAIANAVVTIVEGFASLTWKLASWVGKKLYTLAVDPYDIETLNDNHNSYTVDSLYSASQWSKEVYQYHSSGYDIYQYQHGQLFDRLYNELGKGPLHLDFKAAECIVQRSKSNPLMISIALKYKPLNYKVAPPGIVPGDSAKNAFLDADDYLELMDYYNNNPDDVYLDTNVSEKELFTAFVFAKSFMHAAIAFSYGQSLTFSGSYAVHYPVRAVPTTITNADYFELLTDNCTGDGIVAVTGSNNLVPNYFSHIISILGCFFLQKDEWPLNYDFIPYNHDNVSWNAPRFKLKTDVENVSAFNNFVNTAIIVIAITIIAIKAISLIKNVRVAALAKLQGAQFAASRAIADGLPLTKEHVRNIRKARRICWLLGVLSNGTLSATSTLAVASTYDNSDIINLIK